LILPVKLLLPAIVCAVVKLTNDEFVIAVDGIVPVVILAPDIIGGDEKVLTPAIVCDIVKSTNDEFLIAVEGILFSLT
ncbi:MAG: hypothetical protein ACK56F_05920, partial [bacterium]